MADIEAPGGDLVVQALTEPPASMESWPAWRWSALLRQARRCGLLGRIGNRLAPSYGGSTPVYPAAFGGHLAAAERLMRAQRSEVTRELSHIARALSGLGAPVVVLKGAAYLAADLPPGRERLFSDIDILVPKAALADAEALLTLAGWTGTHLNAYDQRYYREWMHELPPMQHMQRGTTLDLHHNVLPETARLKPKGHHLVEAARPVQAFPGLRVLSPPDMVLHSMTHLFMNEEMSHALRDLSDLDLLLRHFGADPFFWEQLPKRAVLLDLQRPLHYGLRHVQRVFHTPVPAHTAEQASQWGPPRVLAGPMDALWRRAFHGGDPQRAPAGTAAARFALYLRGHWLRMPPLMLARHLCVKALRLHERQPLVQAAAPTNG